MVQRRGRTGIYDTSGNPVAVPGTGALFADPTIVSGSFKDSRSDSALDRADERRVVTGQTNFMLDSGAEKVILDAKEAGELESIVIVADNPYLQAFLQIDDYRNKEPHGETAAELLYAGDLIPMTQSRFRATDSGTPSTGYALVFEPQQPIQYTERLRLVLYNNIAPNTNVYGMDLTFRGRGIPTPAVPAHMGGGVFENNSLSALGMVDFAQAMTTPVGVPPYYNGAVYSQNQVDGSITGGMTLGSDHPYIGSAGRPIFTRSNTAISSITHRMNPAGGGVTTKSTQYQLGIYRAAQRFPGTVASPSYTIIEIIPNVIQENIPLNGTVGASGEKHIYSFLDFGDSGYGGDLNYILTKADTITSVSQSGAVPGSGTDPQTITVRITGITPLEHGVQTGMEITVPASDSRISNVIAGTYTVTRIDAIDFSFEAHVGTSSVALVAGSAGAKNLYLSNPFDPSDSLYPVGKRFFYRKEGQVAFVGKVSDVSRTYNQGKLECGTAVLANKLGDVTAGEPMKGWDLRHNHTSTAGSFVVGTDDWWLSEYYLKVEPGISNVGQNFAAAIDSSATKSRGLTTNHEYASWGFVTSQADTNPHIFVRSVEIKRRKVFSKDG